MTEHVVIGTKDNLFTITVIPEDGKTASANRAWRNDLSDAKYASKISFNTTTCSIGPSNAAAIYKEWYDRIKYADQLAQLLFLKALGSSKLQERVVRIHAAWAESQAVPTDPIEDNPELPLAPYQRVAVCASRLLPGYALFMEQGTGKTPVVVSRICTDAVALRATGESRMLRVIVVVPKNLRSNWKREIERFATVPGKVTIMRGGAVKRVRELAEAMRQPEGEYFSVVVTSYGLLCEAWDSVLSFIHWDLGVVDEGHCIKWHQAKRTQYAHKMRDSCDKRMLLTGTPIVNTALDLYSQLEFLEQGRSGHTSYHGFREKYGVFVKNGGDGRDVLKSVNNVPLLKKRLTECAFIVRKDQVLKDLPEKQYDIIEVEMSARQSSDYDALANQYYLEIEEDLKDAEAAGKREMVVNNAIVKLMKLAQITSGFLIVPEERDETGDVISEKSLIRYDPNPKLQALMECVGQLGEKDKMLVWTCHKYDISVICAALSGAGIEHVQYHGTTNDADRKIAEDRINLDPTCKVFVGNPEAGGAGLNLLGYVPGQNEELGTNVSWMIYYGQNHKPVSRWQSEDRSHRRGTRVPLRITDLVVPDSIDEDIRVRVVDKKKHALDVQDIREMLLNLVKRRQ